jgi:hypothetical protein
MDQSDTLHHLIGELLDLRGELERQRADLARVMGAAPDLQAQLDEPFAPEAPPQPQLKARAAGRANAGRS